MTKVQAYIDGQAISKLETCKGLDPKDAAPYISPIMKMGKDYACFKTPLLAPMSNKTIVLEEPGNRNRVKTPDDPSSDPENYRKKIIFEGEAEARYYVCKTTMDWFQTDNGVVLAKSRTGSYVSGYFDNQSAAAEDSIRIAKEDIAVQQAFYAKWKFDLVGAIYCDGSRGGYEERRDTLELQAEIEAIVRERSNDGIALLEGGYCYGGKGLSYIKVSDKPNITGTTCVSYKKRTDRDLTPAICQATRV